MLHLEGEKTYSISREALFARLTDMQFLVKCLPDLHEVKTVDAVARRDCLGKPERGAGVEQPHFAGLELAREECEHAGAGADVGDRADARLDRLLQRRAERFVTGAICQHASMEFDRHAEAAG